MAKYVLAYHEGKVVYKHRLVWFLAHGEWPKGQINHINGDRQDNNLDNLEVVTNRENNQRKTRHLDGRLPGAHFHKRDKAWMSSGKIEGKTKYFGYYKTEQEAHEAYLKGIKND